MLTSDPDAISVSSMLAWSSSNTAWSSICMPHTVGSSRGNWRVSGYREDQSPRPQLERKALEALLKNSPQQNSPSPVPEATLPIVLALHTI